MVNKHLVSIIIPTYNRAHLIGETLDSIINQTYTNWECIVIDDDSTDNTNEILTSYCKKDSRFKYHHRPQDRPKGANTCRNYGFELSKGEYINWFDSDDIMKHDRLESYVNVFNSYKEIDFVIFKSNYFFDISLEKAVDYKDIELKPNFENFALQRIFWFTIDIMYKKLTLKNILWDTYLFSGQEYNFICNYLSYGFIGVFNNAVKTKVRKHEDSIQGKQHPNLIEYNKNKFQIFFRTFKKIKDRTTKIVDEFLLTRGMYYCFESVKMKRLPRQFLQFLWVILIKRGIIKTMLFILSLFLAFTIKSGFSLLKLSRK